MIRSIQTCLARCVGAIVAVVLCAASPLASALTSQTITFGTLSARNYGTAPFAVSATASSGLAVTFSSTSTNVCTVSGNTVTLVAPGPCSIAANQAGNSTYAAAPQVTQSFTVSPGAQTITFPTIAGVTYGIAPFTLNASNSAGSGGSAITFSSSTSSVCNVSGSTATVVGVGNCTITAQAVSNRYYTAATATQTFTVSGEAQTITFPALANLNMGSSETASATASSGLTVQYSSLTTSVCTVSPGGNITTVAIGLCTIAANQSGNSSVSAAAQVTQSFNVLGKAQTITFAALSNKAYGSAAFGVSATASSALAISYSSSSSTTGVCTVSGSTVTLVAAGFCSITASQAGNSTYAAATPVTQSFTVSQLSQTISFGTLGSKAYGSAPFNVSATATATSGLAVAFTSGTTGICTVSGNTVTIAGVGNCTINANQAGNADYTAAGQVSQTFAVTQTSQSISFAAPAGVAYGASPVSLNATAGSGLAVSYSSSTTGVCTVSGSSAVIVAPGTCTVTASQAGNTNYAAATSVTQNFSVTQASQSISFTAPAGVAFGASPVSLSATASSGLAVSYSSSTTGVCTVSGNSLTIVAPGTCTIIASQAGNVDYAAATAVTQNFSVTQASQSISFATLPSKILGQSAFGVSATASSGLTVGFASTTTSVCTVSGAAVTLVASGTCTIIASQAGNTNYAAAANVTQSFGVAADVAPSVSITSPTAGQGFSAPASITLSANASSSDASIAQVQFYNGSTLIGSATQSPYSVTWSNVATGSYSVTAVATDNLGTSTTSAAVAVTVNNPIAVTLTSPSAGQTYYANSPLTLTASVTDTGGSVTQVAFYNGSTLLGTITQAPYSISVPNLPAGNYSFSAVATDSNSQSGASAPVTITVSPLTTDPNFANVQLLLHMDGANGSATFTDIIGHPITNNNAQITAAQSMFGGASMATQGTGYVSTPAAPELVIGNNDFTVEMWVYQTNANAGVQYDAWYQSIFMQQQFGTQSSATIGIWTRNGVVSAGFTSGQNSQTQFGATTALTPNTWNHIALVGQGSTLTLYVNGQSAVTAQRSAAAPASTLPFTIGADAVGAGVFTGYIDEVRFTNGLARYTGNFTPTGPFANTGGQTQSISFTAPGEAVVGASIALNATASFGLPVTYTSATPNICSVGGSTGNSLSMLTPGNCTVAAIQAGAENIQAASLTQTIAVAPAQAAPTTDPNISQVALLLHLDGANGSTVFTDVRGHPVAGAGSAPRLTSAQSVTGGASFAAAGTSYLVTAAAPEFSFGSNSFTVEGWVYPQNLASPATQGIVTQQLFTTTGEGALCLCVQNGQLIGNLLDANGNLSGVTGPALTANAWSHVALVGTASTLTLYLNGQRVGSAARGAAQNVSPLPIAIGADAQGSGIFAGDIDDVRITNGVARYSANFTPSAPYPDNDIGNGSTNSTTRTYTLGAGQQGATTISGNAGSVIAINLTNVATTPGGGSVSLTIANPDGSILGTYSVNDGTATASFATPTLTQNGTYVLNINPGTSAASLSAGLSIVGQLSVTLTNPSNGATYTPDNLSLGATATEPNGTITQVSYYNGVSLLGTATQAPYGIDLKDLAPGTYTLSAQATDAMGRTAASNVITITVAANGGGGSGAETVYDVHTDHLDTPRMCTDQSANIVWQWDNDEAFGNNPPNQDPNGTGKQFVFNLRFPGQYFDIETGTNYNGKRDYDTATGRYLQSDPIGLKGGSLSTYPYVDSRPTKYIDEDGQQAATAVPVAVGVSLICLATPGCRKAVDRAVRACFAKEASKDTPNEECKKDAEKQYDMDMEECSAYYGAFGSNTWRTCKERAAERLAKRLRECDGKGD